MDFTDNVTNSSEEFNCLADSISSVNISNATAWKIREELRRGSPAVATVFAIYFIVAFCWNLFIILTFLKRRKLLREPANILLLNLAIADIAVAITQMFFSVVTESYKEFVFGMSDVVRCGMCNFVGVFFMLLYGVSMHTLALLSFDRFLLLYKPFKYKKIMTQRTTIIFVLGIWLIATILAVPPVLGFGQIEFNLSFGSCVPRFSGTNLKSQLSNFYYVMYVAVESLFPIITIMLCSFWTYWFVNKFLKRNYRRRSFYNRRGTEGATQQRHEDTRYHRQQQQLVKVFGALLMSNLVSWSPVLIVIIVVGVIGAEQVKHEVYVFGWICFLTAPVFHPIIESFFVKDMRLVVCKGLNRARDASSFIARSTTNMFGNKDIELANEKLSEDKDYISKRQIKFFGRRNRGMSAVSMTTEVTEVTEIPAPLSRDTTPSPKMAQKVKEANNSVDVQLRDKTSDSGSNVIKPTRRITFSDESPPNLHLDTESPVTHNSAKKSVLKSPRVNDRSFLAPLGELEAEKSQDSSSNGSVFEDSPCQQENGIMGFPGGGGERDLQEEKPVKQETQTGLGNGSVTLVPVRDTPACNGTSGETPSNQGLQETGYSERRGSWTLV